MRELPVQRPISLFARPLSDVENQFIRQEIADYVERADEKECLITLFARVTPRMQKLAELVAMTG